MRLVVDGFGKFVGVENGLIVVRDKSSEKKYKPDELKQLIISGKSAMSSEAIRLLARNGVDVVFISQGEIVARLSNPLVGTVKTRREQYLAYYDRRGFLISKEILKAKMKNQSAILLNLAKSRRENPELAEKLVEAKEKIELCFSELCGVEAEKIEDVREKILGIEGKASNFYWEALSFLIPQEYGFSGRRGLEVGSPRYAQDMVNAMLNYGYAILLSECMRAVELAGLDPYAGFLHSDKSGRTSLALDLMECFRQHIVDRAVLKLISLEEVKAEDCEIKNFVCQLKDKARRALLSEILKRLEAKTQYRGKNISMSSVILSQAREIAKFLRGEESYAGFTQNW